MISLVDAQKVNLRIARFEDKDLEGIWNLCRRSFAMYRDCSLEDFCKLWRHKWIENPARTAEHVFGWVLETPEDGVVGFIGIAPLRLKVGQKEVVGGTPHTQAVSRTLVDGVELVEL